MDNQLEPGESVIYRGTPGWRTAAIAIACGFSFAAAIHLVVGVLDDNWTCPASLLWLIVMTPFSALLISRTASARLILTERRLLYRRSRSTEIDEISLADIEDATLSMSEILPSVRVSRRGGDDILIKYVARLEDLCHRIRHPDGGAPTAPRTLRGATLIVVASFGASFGLWLGMIGLISLISLEPTGTIKGIPEWRESADFPARTLVSIAVTLLTFALAGPIIAASALGAWLGYLPALLASRFLVPFGEARNLAMLPRRLTSIFDLKGEAKPSENEKRTNRIFMIVIVWTALWGVLVGKLICASTDQLARLLFRRPVTLDCQAAIEMGDD